MSKLKTAFFCQNCGNKASKWLGKCPACAEWNSYVEEVIESEDKPFKTPTLGSNSALRTAKPQKLQDIAALEQPRYITQDQELNRVLGGGIVPGSLVLIGGEPGIGKSTLLLQLALSLPTLKVLYISGEESETQIKMRADRLNNNPVQCYVYTETETTKIFGQIADLTPDIIVVDSIQTLYSSAIDATPGSVSQIRQCAGEFMRFAKENNIPVFLIGHITKDGSIAGPKILEHLVDTVLQFEGDRNHTYRILRTIKNRFGSSSELGIYEMRGDGLRQVPNPSEILLTQRTEPCSGVAIGTTLEGNRPMLIEVQSLVSKAAYGTPQRSATGFDAKRLNMLLAVLEKRGGFQFYTRDVFLNIAGGIKIEDPAIDLSVCAALVASYEDMQISTQFCFAAEVGLGGEIRPVTRIENRILEAEKLGFEAIFISKHNKVALKDKKIKVILAGKLEEVLQHLFG